MIKKCRLCGKKLYPLITSKWKEDKSLCWECGYCQVTEYLAKKYGKDIRKEIYNIENKTVRGRK